MAAVTAVEITGQAAGACAHSVW